MSIPITNASPGTRNRFLYAPITPTLGGVLLLHLMDHDQQVAGTRAPDGRNHAKFQSIALL